MLMKGFHYRHGMMTVFYSTNLPVASYGSIVEEVGGRKVIKDWCFVVILDELHLCEAVCELKVEGGYAWTETKLCMQQIMH